VNDPSKGGICGFLADHRDWLGCILVHQSATLTEAARASGAWNLVFCQDGDVLMRSHPGGPGGEEQFLDVLSTVRTRALLGHFDPAGELEEANALRSMGWIYTQDVETPGFREAVRDQLRSHLPDFLSRSMRGKGEAEHLFHLVLAFLYDSGDLKDPDLPGPVLLDGVRNALAMLDQVYPQSELPLPRMTFVVSNCYSAAGFTGSGPLPIRVYSRPVGDEAEIHRGVGVRRSSREVPPYPRTGQRAVLLGSFVQDGFPGSFTGAIAPRTLFCVTRDLEIHTRSL
jgi:hypothetical protein